MYIFIKDKILTEYLNKQKNTEGTNNVPHSQFLHTIKSI